mgnify:CR=1 FL=1|tara:strand:- start:353 stop:721 length:369 start_codon:yes stop_codon:yes gene_type:complete
MKIYSGDAIQSLRPNAEFVVSETDGVRTINWLDSSQTQPTDDEINAEIDRLQGLEAMKLLRNRRTNLLARSDWRANSDVTMSEEWKTYRQQLRDLPSSSSPKLTDDYDLDLTSVTWPTEPSS